MSLTGFHHIGRLLEVGCSQGRPDWELTLRVWGYLVARINEYVGVAPAPLPPDVQLWERLTVLRTPLQAVRADRRRGSEWERHKALDIVARLLANGAARRRAGPPPPWLTISTLAGTLENVYDSLQREESQERATVMALHAVEAWRRERDGPQPNLRRPERTTALHRLNPRSSSEAASGEGEGAGKGDSNAARPEDADAMECDDEDDCRRRQEWCTVFHQSGIREPVLGLLRAAEAKGWPEAETALKLWAYLASHVNAPLHETQTVQPPTPGSNFWNRMGKARRRTVDRAAVARAFFLHGAEFYLTRSETQRAELPPPPEWATLDQLAGDLSAVGDKLANSAHEEPMDRAQPPITRVALKSWENERNGPQRPLRARRWQEQLHYLAQLLTLRPAQREAHGP
ncbi:UNVERIFIED_CONTAM: hypothetical protein K2H54_038109 [Gekko kuhli]